MLTRTHPLSGAHSGWQLHLVYNAPDLCLYGRSEQWLGCGQRVPAQPQLPGSHTVYLFHARCRLLSWPSRTHTCRAPKCPPCLSLVLCPRVRQWMPRPDDTSIHRLALLPTLPWQSGPPLDAAMYSKHGRRATTSPRPCDHPIMMTPFAAARSALS